MDSVTFIWGVTRISTMTANRSILSRFRLFVEGIAILCILFCQAAMESKLGAE